MNIKAVPKWKDIHTIAFDFDGVFTDNKVYVDEKGKEHIRCDRADGLGLDIIRKYAELVSWNINMFILSKEKNPVVIRRSEKLNIDCFNGESNKLKFIKNYLHNCFGNSSDARKGLVYLGNDLNDLGVMKYAGYTFAPLDSHPLILKESDYIINRKGGNGFVRAALEKLIDLKNIDNDTLMNLVN